MNEMTDEIMNDQQKNLLLNAAKAMGFGYSGWCSNGVIIHKKGHFNPLHNPKDLQDMICKLRIDAYWWSDEVGCGKEGIPMICEKYADHETDQQAYAWCCIRVASAIYEAKE